jgi:hypothetical protein
MIEVERVIYEHAYGERFSAAVAATLSPQTIEVDLSICAAGPAIMNRRVSEVLADIEKHVPTPLALLGQKAEPADDDESDD